PYQAPLLPPYRATQDFQKKTHPADPPAHLPELYTTAPAPEAPPDPCHRIAPSHAAAQTAPPPPQQNKHGATYPAPPAQPVSDSAAAPRTQRPRCEDSLHSSAERPSAP